MNKTETTIKPIFRGFIILLLMALSNNASAQNLSKFNTMPEFNEVVTKFCTQYQTEYYQNGNLLSFRKKYGLWEVYQYNYETNKVVNEEVFYSNNEYHILKKIKKQKDSKLGKKSNAYKQLAIARNFNDYKRHPFYGYHGFAKDAIAFLSPLENQLNDTLHYGLGRCYSHMAIHTFGLNIHIQTLPIFRLSEEDPLSQKNKK